MARTLNRYRWLTCLVSVALLLAVPSSSGTNFDLDWGCRILRQDAAKRSEAGAARVIVLNSWIGPIPTCASDPSLNLDLVWLKDESLEDRANLRDPDIIAAEIVEDLQAALAQFAEIAVDLKR